MTPWLKLLNLTPQVMAKYCHVTPHPAPNPFEDPKRQKQRDCNRVCMARRRALLKNQGLSVLGQPMKRSENGSPKPRKPRL